MTPIFFNHIFSGKIMLITTNDFAHKGILHRGSFSRGSVCNQPGFPIYFIAYILFSSTNGTFCYDQDSVFEYGLLSDHV